MSHSCVLKRQRCEHSNEWRPFSLPALRPLLMDLLQSQNLYSIEAYLHETLLQSEHRCGGVMLRGGGQDFPA